MDHLNHIMISGTGRSGTNITKAIFARHSKVATLPFEYRIIIDPDGIIDFYNSFTASWSPFASDKKIKDLHRFLTSKSRQPFTKSLLGKIIKQVDPSGLKITAPPYYGWELQEWIPDYEMLVERLIDQLKAFDFNGRWPGSDGMSRSNRMCFSDLNTKEKLAPVLKAFVNGITQSILKKQDRSFFVEDNTWNILFARELFEIIPEARLIHLIRDPRDVVASFIKQKWCPGKLSEAIIFYKAIVQRWLMVEPSLAKEQYLNIKFENLIREPEETTKKMCRFSNLEFQEEMIHLDLSKANSGRWKKEFSNSEIKTIESELQKEISTFGYDL